MRVMCSLHDRLKLVVTLKLFVMVETGDGMV